MSINDKMCMDLDTLRDHIEDQIEVHKITSKCTCCGYKDLEANLIWYVNEETGHSELLCEDCFINKAVSEMERMSDEEAR